MKGLRGDEVENDGSARRAFRWGRRPLVGFIAFLSAFTPISTDLYLPALPSMIDVFSSTAETVSLTISLFMLFFALSMPVWGPLSDRYGRRPILLAGSFVYMAASVVCMSAADIRLFIAARCLQAVGGGALGTVAMAIVKDVFRGRLMENMLATVQVIMVIAPVVSPILGAFLLDIASWRVLFAVLTVCGCIGAAGTLFLLRETLPEAEIYGIDNREGPLKSLLRLVTVLKNRTFRILLVIFALPTMCFMSYLTCSSYIYITEFGLTPRMYSFYFAVNAGASVLGPLLYVRFFRDIPKNSLFAGAFFVLTLNGAAIYLLGHHSALVFMLFIVCMGITSHLIRPSATMLLMNAVDKNSGTASSLIGSVNLLFGSMGMLLCALPWPSSVTAVAVIGFCAASVSLILWLVIGRHL